MKYKIAILSMILLLAASSCHSSVKVRTDPSDTLYIRKIDGIADDFIFGMDLSSVISLEQSGVRYYDFDGSEQDIFKILSENGINHIRVRIWNDPYDADGNGYGGGNCDIDKAIEIGKRAKTYGMKLIVDFHYSDFWADPGKQAVPKAWIDMNSEEKADALYQYTIDCLKLLKEAKIDVSIVQIGNETNGAMAGEKVWMNIIYHLMTGASKAIREVYPKALIAVHFANPENKDAYLDYAAKLAYYDLDYDVFATSYYPYWHGSLDNLSDVLSTIAQKYDKKVMVMETSYAYTAEDTDFHPNTISDVSLVTKNYPYSLQGQTNAILDIIDTIANKTVNGIGVCYWEGAWISVGTASEEANRVLWEKYGSGWASSYAKEYDPNDAGKYYGGSAVDNQAFFDEHGKVLESLKLFALCREGNIIERKADAIDDSSISLDVGDELVLPSQVEAIMNDNSRELLDVVWNKEEQDRIDTHQIGEYVVNGLCGGLDAKCHISIQMQNYVKNASFEDDEHGTSLPEYWKLNDRGDANELYVEEKRSDSLSGIKHYHFWSDNAHKIDFDLEQSFTDLKAGTYHFSISIMGGDVSSGEIYAYVKIDDRIIATDDLAITTYNNWDNADITFAYDGSADLTIGIHVACQGMNNGAWGKIDDAVLNRIGE